MSAPEVAAVVIGRNEGAHLKACLASLDGEVGRVVYVDSGSTDDSVAVGLAAGAEVVELDPALPFTAARARNAGVDALGEIGLPELIQFIDGDCTLVPSWIATARAAFATEPKLAVACGRRRERHPDASVYTRMIDREWDTPVGLARACGGDSMMRSAAFRQVGGFDPALIAGEEPDLCIRLRAAGWKVRRLDAEMTRHDAGITRFTQFWQRARRAGHAYAEGAARHGAPPEQHYAPQLRRCLLWGAALPLATLVLTLAISPWFLLLALAYPLQILRLARSRGLAEAALLTVGKIAEAQGALGYRLRRLGGRRSSLVEYK
ncbi:glycosyltransferase family 2 protein [Tropicimonas aquimaris]|uniref:Glycosyltransferase family 2 protein n=1 Tax=Tropicimonas aquimaris TaxID=914152 RepID=A0ABW3ILH5_9RHOB